MGTKKTNPWLSIRFRDVVESNSFDDETAEVEEEDKERLAHYEVAADVADTNQSNSQVWKRKRSKVILAKNI
jgi:hypothetical protein